MKILLADDEKDLLDGLSTILKMNHYAVDCCHDGEEAIALLSLYSYDVVILDIMMPKKDGYEVLKTMRDRGDQTPVIFLTAKSELDDKIKGFDLGADDYLGKPFSGKELLARIKALLRRSSRMEGFVLSFGNTILDTSDFSIRNGEKKDPLVNKEFQIMELLISSPKKVFSSEKIMEHVWPYDSLADISTVWSFISNLRRKLKKIDSNILIKSNRGLGYSLEESHV